jgi:3-phenylpropionate/trans-cinnamate dioxygenase ferredoxin reductase subunit
VNGSLVEAIANQSLVDAALLAGLVIPHDCSSGQCETCRVKVLSGSVDPKGTADGDTVLACQARVIADAEIVFEEIPAVVKRVGQVSRIDYLSSTVVQVKIALTSRLPYLPGQYVNLSFAGFPERAYSITHALDAEADELELVFHIRRFVNGVVSAELGRKIQPGRSVVLRGPFGHAYLRSGPNKLIFVSSGTGFAPIWSMALASTLSNPQRPLSLIVGVSDAARLYMGEALHWLRARGVTDITTTARSGAGNGILAGQPIDFLPELDGTEDIYAAGNPAMVAAVKSRGQLAGARCFADPFNPSLQKPPLLKRLSRFLQQKAIAPSAPPLKKKTA